LFGVISQWPWTIEEEEEEEEQEEQEEN